MRAYCGVNMDGTLKLYTLSRYEHEAWNKMTNRAMADCTCRRRYIRKGLTVVQVEVRIKKTARHGARR